MYTPVQRIAIGVLIAAGIALTAFAVAKLPFLFLTLGVVALFRVRQVQNLITVVGGFAIGALIVVALASPLLFAAASAPPMFWWLVVAVAIGAALSGKSN